MTTGWWECPHCLDRFEPDDDDRPPVCIMCRKAGRVAESEISFWEATGIPADYPTPKCRAQVDPLTLVPYEDLDQLRHVRGGTGVDS